MGTDGLNLDNRFAVPPVSVKAIITSALGKVKDA